MEAANRFLTEEYLPGHNEKFAIKLIGDGSAFVPFAGDLANVLCVQEDRVVALFVTKIVAFRYRQIAIETTTSKPVFGSMNIQTANWRYSMGRENSPFTPLKERKSKTPKTWLRELLRPAEPRKAPLLAYGSQNCLLWKTEPDKCHGT